MARILLIEDDPNSANIVTRIMKRRGHEVIHAGEGLTGLNIVSREKVDLVLLDLGLPDIGGHTIAALINRIPGDIPIIAVTANDDPIVERRALTYGCDGYITKPINTRTFPDQIEAFLAAADGGEETEQEEKHDQSNPTEA
ncbi:MAG TPA: response regulator [Chloroflexi bacterium]|nr:response regulator [Chloroflexota bacterium]